MRGDWLGSQAQVLRRQLWWPPFFRPLTGHLHRAGMATHCLCRLGPPGSRVREHSPHLKARVPVGHKIMWPASECTVDCGLTVPARSPSDPSLSRGVLLLHKPHRCTWNESLFFGLYFLFTLNSQDPHALQDSCSSLP